MTKNNEIDILTMLGEARTFAKRPSVKANYTRAIKGFHKMTSEYNAVKARAEFLTCKYAHVIINGKSQECSFGTPLEDKCAACFIKGTLK